MYFWGSGAPKKTLYFFGLKNFEFIRLISQPTFKPFFGLLLVKIPTWSKKKWTKDFIDYKYKIELAIANLPFFCIFHIF